MNKRFKVFSAVGVILIVALLATALLPSLAAAGSLKVVRMSLSDNTNSQTAVDFDAVFQTPTGLVATDKIVLTFRIMGAPMSQGIDVVTDGAITATVTEGAAEPPATLVTLTSATGAENDPDADTWTIVLNDTIAINQYIGIAVDGEINTPTTDGTYVIDIQTLTAADVVIDSASAAIVIGDNQVQITGTVDPTLTLTLGDFEAGFTNACPLGTLEVSKLAACGYSATVTTNAVNGYTSYIREDHGLWNLADNTKIIAAVADGAVTPGGTPTTEEYGLAVQTVDTLADFSAFTGGCVADVRDSTDPQDADALATTDQPLASYNTPVNGTTHGKTYLCHVARRHGATVAGNYGQTVTITVVGNF